MEVKQTLRPYLLKIKINLPLLLREVHYIVRLL